MFMVVTTFLTTYSLLMAMTPLQCRMARTATGWTAADLANAADVSVNTVTKFERGADARTSTVTAMKSALEYAGVVFVGSGEDSPSGGEGVRFTASGVSVLERLIDERDDAHMELAKARAEKPESNVAGHTGALRAAMSAEYVRTLESRIDSLQRRIDRLD